MKQKIENLLQNGLLLILLNVILVQTAFFAVVIFVMQTPPEAIIDSGLDQVLLVFEEFPD